jgi:DUF4097 and DUF4098 domain-containing protein YvlB
MFFIVLSAFSNGNLELVNTQEIDLDNIIDVKVLYSSEKVSVFMGTSNKLIIKEYMNENNSKYYARITKSANNITIENGRWPFRLFFNVFIRRLEIYLPVSYSNTLNIKTSSGRIESSDELSCSKINIESSSGSISINTITADTIKIKTTSGRVLGERIQGNVNINTNSGSIVFGRIVGNVSAETSNGKIEFNVVTGSVNAKTTSGSIQCTINEPGGNISLTTSSGGVRVSLPRNFNFNFYSHTSSGRLTTPFSDNLFSPVNNRNSTQGVIGNTSENIPTINIRTRSGSINIDWI